MDTETERLVRESFARQTFMRTLGAEIVSIAPGRVEISFLRREGLAQQHGFLHAGVAASVSDSACGYAAMSGAPAGSEVLTIEFKSNFLRPASGDSFLAIGQVIRAGSQIVSCQGEVHETAPGNRLIATMSATMFLRQGT
jgi:uncharacterized protein (TIGR00369 family)